MDGSETEVVVKVVVVVGGRREEKVSSRSQNGIGGWMNDWGWPERRVTGS